MYIETGGESPPQTQFSAGNCAKLYVKADIFTTKHV